MYNLIHLLTFVRVAELGSFSKVAEEQYLSVNAVMKQINNLENELEGIKLFERTNRGNVLTSVGEALYIEAKKILENCEESRIRIINSGRAYNNTLRIAISANLMTEKVETIIDKAHSMYPQIFIERVESGKNMKEVLLNWKNFGEWTDLALETYTEDDFEADNYLGLEGHKICSVPIYCLCSKSNPLASKEIIKLNELNDYKIHMPKMEIAAVLSSLRQEIEKESSDATIKLHDFFTNSVYNDVANSDELLVDITGYRRVHPLIKAIPIDYEPMSYGLIYRKDAPEKVKLFLNCIKTIIEEEKRNNSDCNE